jgi:hypothetical protein
LCIAQVVSVASAQEVHLSGGDAVDCLAVETLRVHIVDPLTDVPSGLVLAVERLPRRSEARPHRFRIEARLDAHSAQRVLELGPSDCGTRHHAVALVALMLVQSLEHSAEIETPAGREIAADAGRAEPPAAVASASGVATRATANGAAAAGAAPGLRPATGPVHVPMNNQEFPNDRRRLVRANDSSSRGAASGHLPRSQWLLGLGAAVRSGLGPDPAACPHLKLALRWPRLGSIELRTSVAWPQRHEVEEGSLELTAYSAALGACLAPLPQAPGLSLCADVQGGLGVGAAHGLGVANHTRAHPLLVIAGRVEFEALRVGPGRIAFWADAGGVVIQPRFVVSRSDQGSPRKLGASAFSGAFGTTYSFVL